MARQFQQATVVEDGQRVSISRQVAQSVSGTSYQDLPPQVVARAKALILDAIGIGFASRAEVFSGRAAEGILRVAGSGRSTVLGSAEKIDAGNAAIMNGLLIHGLDFDDTHLAGVIHASASALPAALAIGELERKSGEEVLRAFVLGCEVAIRVGMVAEGEFHAKGFHPTGVAGAFGSAITAGLLFGLDSDELTTAQGIVGSMASGLLEFLEEGTWTKRLHPGWAAHAGITAASLAKSGFTGPTSIYEGRFGLFATHIGAEGRVIEKVAKSIGETWEVMNVAIKPYPACHFTHAFIDSALEIRSREEFSIEDIEKILCKISEGEVGTVCEPVETKRNPQTPYDAQFSVPYTTARALIKQERLNLRDFDESAIREEDVLQLTRKVDYEVDPFSGFPKHFSGEVVLELRDGRVLSWREQINRGAPERELSTSEIREKFDRNTEACISVSQSEAIAEAIGDLETFPDIEQLTSLLGIERV